MFSGKSVLLLLVHQQEFDAIYTMSFHTENGGTISSPILCSSPLTRDEIPSTMFQDSICRSSCYLNFYSELEFFPYEGNHDAAPKPSLSFIEDNNGVCIRDSCNGLLLCSSFRCSNEEERKYYICQPTTKQYFSLPKPPCEKVVAINIVCNLKRSPYYQVVCICDSKTLPNFKYCEVKIYHSRTRSWRDSGNPCIIKDDILFERGIYSNGAIHWVGRGEKSLRFDVENELMHWIPMPAIKDGWTERRIGYFGESRGNLYLIENYGPSVVARLM
ncbi:hypothetical protein Pint_30754 [Pistacia integerrima]|uniref:Uncharacterized protein n=1 Tax=Pistacia integerrima TaxID=434235 RepID=A0ACC0X3B0_9ROSI|nr:hypothetical protein Pint_30754 [Pistacia integerrima]